jgi:Nif-specific regulatory protein
VLLDSVAVAESPDRPSVLLSVGDLLRREVDVDTILAKIIDLIVGAMDADRGTIYLVDPKSGEIYSKVAHLPELAEIRLAPGQGVAGQVARTGVAVNLPDASTDQRHFREIDRRTGYRTRSLLAVPVREQTPNGTGRVIGVLQVLNKKGNAKTFNAGDEATLSELATQVSAALDEARLPAPAGRYNRILGESKVMSKVYDRIASAAVTDASVLVRGESGTGKELVARAIHFNSGRSRGPFVKVDCTTLPAGLIESELFGHEKGAFTGADRQVIGKCELAHGGTLFLDEIGDLPIALQGKLLRFLQDREFERLGGRKTIKADVRIVAATNRDLEAQVKRGELRQDLYYRLKVVELRLPPLRDRGPQDIALLANHFLRLYTRKHGKKVTKFSAEALDRLKAHNWPGNIRELEHCVESAVVVCEGEVVLVPDLALAPAGASLAATARDEASAEGSAAPLPTGLTLAELERRYIRETLAHSGGNRTKAAQTLGIGRNTLLRKLKEAGLANGADDSGEDSSPDSMIKFQSK